MRRSGLIGDWGRGAATVPWSAALVVGRWLESTENYNGQWLIIGGNAEGSQCAPGLELLVVVDQVGIRGAGHASWEEQLEWPGKDLISTCIELSGYYPTACWVTPVYLRIPTIL